MWKLLLEKLGMSVLVVCCFLIGIFGYSLTLAPINLPFLLKLPVEADSIFAAVFALLFVCVATVITRTTRCIEEDMFLMEDGKLGSLLRCVLTSWEYIADVIVFALLNLILEIVIGVTSGAPWYAVVSGIAIMVVGGMLAFALLDCILYVFARKRADRRLRKLQRKREQ